jgi:hypothetical protein
MASWEFPAAEPVEAEIRVASGSVTVLAEPTATVTVGISPDIAGTRVELDGRRLTIDAPKKSSLWRSESFDVTVTVPQGSSCTADTASADVRCHGRLRDVTLVTASGDVAAGHVTGTAEVRTASGGVWLDECGAARVTSASGDVTIGAAGADVLVRTASGDATLRAVSRGRIEVNTASGDITVAVTPGTGVQFDLSTLSGQASSDLQPADPSGAAELTLTCRSISGDVRVIRAAQAPAS